MRINCDLNANDFSLQEDQILDRFLSGLRSNLVICCPVKWVTCICKGSQCVLSSVLTKVISDSAVFCVLFIALTPCLKLTSYFTLESVLLNVYDRNRITSSVVFSMYLQCSFFLHNSLMMCDIAMCMF